MKKTEKIRYEIDPHNRLVYEKTGEKSEVPGFRTVLDGNFEIDENNYVTYHVKKSQGYDVPQQVKLRGGWALRRRRLCLFLEIAPGSVRARCSGILKVGLKPI